METNYYLGIPTLETVDYDRIYHFSSRDFDLEQVFHPYLNNRGFNADRKDTKPILNHIDNIKKAILEAGTMRYFPPLFVDIKNYVIADGNCRWNAALSLLKERKISELTIGVIFIDIPEEEFDNYVITLNTTSKSWTLNDYIYNYASRSSDTGHKKLIDFCESHSALKKENGGISPRYGLAILKKQQSQVKSNKFSLTDEEIAVANSRLIEALEVRAKIGIEDIKSNGGGWFEPYLSAWAMFRDDKPNVDISRYLREANTCVKQRKSKVRVPYGSTKKNDWYQLFSNIFSFCV